MNEVQRSEPDGSMELLEAIERVAEYGGEPRTWQVGENAHIRWDLDGLVVSTWAEPSAPSAGASSERTHWSED